jgi:DNA-binding response OmpR family regulator
MNSKTGNCWWWSPTPLSGSKLSRCSTMRDMRSRPTTGCREGIKAVLAFDPDAVIMGADPPQLDCCDLLSEIKGTEHTQNIRVVMLSPGGTAAFSGLDLGADDVLSLPFDSHELLSRVRSQLRNKSVANEFGKQLRLAEENRNATQQVARRAFENSERGPSLPSDLQKHVHVDVGRVRHW